MRTKTKDIGQAASCFPHFTQHHKSSQGIQQRILELNVSFSDLRGNFYLSQHTAAQLLFYIVDDSIATQSKSYPISVFRNSFSQNYAFFIVCRRPFYWIPLPMVLKVPKTIPRYHDLLGRLTGFSIWSLLYFSKWIQSKISKGKRYMGHCLEETRSKPLSLLSVESHRTCLIIPAMNCENACDTLSISEAQGFYWWLVI